MQDGYARGETPAPARRDVHAPTGAPAQGASGSFGTGIGGFPAPSNAPIDPSRGSDPYRDPELELLTDREREVLVEIAHGLSNQEIADKLFISLPTVKTHVAHILSKIHARDRVQAVVFAYDNELV
ncbi:response regulator transcription factor [Bifidobacterium santillanense]